METTPPLPDTTRRYEPIEERSLWLIRILLATLVVDAIAIASGLAELSLLSRAADGNISDAAADASDARQRIIGIVQASLFFTGAVCFIRWLRRLTSNLTPLGAGSLRFGTGWATISWFIPILNLWRPKQVTNDAWRASDPGAPTEQGDAWRGTPVPRYLQLWWASWLAVNFVAQAAFRVTRSAESLAQITVASQITLASDVVAVAADTAALVLVRRLTARQAARAKTTGAVSGPASLGTENYGHGAKDR